MKKLLFGMLLLSSALIAQDIETGLVGYYPFNANADDHGPFQNDGQLSSFIDRTTDRFNLPFTAYEFDNLQDIITTPNIPQLNFSGDFTVSIWAYPSSITSFEMIQKSSAVFPPYAILLSGLGNVIFRMQTSNGTFTLEIPGGYTLNEWQLFTAVRSGNQMLLYRNDVLIGQQAVTGANTSNADGLRIGTRIATSNPIPARKLDDVRLYDRALTPADITALFQFQDACPTGPVVINSQADLTLYQTNFPDCTSLPQGLTIEGNDVTDLSSFDSLLSIFGDLVITNNANLGTISGLDALLEIFSGDLRVTNNSSLTTLDTFANKISVEDHVVEFSNNSALLNLDGFDGVREPAEFILDNNDALQDFFGITLIEVDNLVIARNDGLTNVALGSLDSVGSLIIEENINLETLNGMPNSQLIIQNGFHIINNDNLIDIDGFNASQLSVSGTLEITGNDNLSLCSTLVICNVIDIFSDVIVSDNAFGCNSAAEIIAGCGLNINFLFGSVFFDSDNDGCSPLDIPASGVMIDITNGTESFQTTVYENGNYARSFPLTGTFDVSVNPASISGFQVSPNSQSVTFSGFNNTEIIDFCLTATVNGPDAGIVILPLNEARPGFDSEYEIRYQNAGSETTSGTITLEFDDTRQTFLMSNPAPTNVSGNNLSWDYTDLQAFESQSILLEFNNFPPPTNQSGDILVFDTVITTDNPDLEPEDNEYVFEQVVVNSQDPNDKLVLQGAEIHVSEVGDYLEYIVRFQNVGTADAIFVRIEDELSGNLQWDTFEVLSASHDFRTEIIDDNFVTFVFDDIFLPPVTVDPEGSNGYVAFRLRSIGSLDIGDTIENSADIFFDFNDAIVTNTVVTEVVENLGLNESELQSLVQLYPNPVKDKLQILLSEELQLNEVIMYTVLGEEVIRTSEGYLELQSINTGIYFVSVITDRGELVKKIVKL